MCFYAGFEKRKSHIRVEYFFNKERARFMEGSSLFDMDGYAFFNIHLIPADRVNR